MSSPHLTDGDTKAQSSKGLPKWKCDVVHWKKTLLSLYYVPDNMQESGDTAVNKTCNPGPWKALPASGEMIGLQINILKVNANYNYSRCLEIQMQEVLFLL